MGRLAERTVARIAVFALIATALVWTMLPSAAFTNEFRDAQVMNLHELAAVDTVRRFGELPLWDPWYCGGLYALGAPQSRFASPTFLSSLLFGVERSEPLVVFLFAILGMEGTYRWVRLRVNDATAALRVAPMFALSGYFAVAHFRGWTSFFGFELVPFVLLGITTAARGRTSGIAVASIAFAVMLGFGGTFAAPLVAVAAVIEAIRALLEQPPNAGSARRSCSRRSRASWRPSRRSGSCRSPRRSPLLLASWRARPGTRRRRSSTFSSAFSRRTTATSRTRGCSSSVAGSSRSSARRVGPQVDPVAARGHRLPLVGRRLRTQAAAVRAAARAADLLGAALPRAILVARHPVCVRARRERAREAASPRRRSRVARRRERAPDGGGRGDRRRTARDLRRRREPARARLGRRRACEGLPPGARQPLARRALLGHRPGLAVVLGDASGDHVAEAPGRSRRRGVPPRAGRRHRAARLVVAEPHRRPSVPAQADPPPRQPELAPGLAFVRRHRRRGRRPARRRPARGRARGHALVPSHVRRRGRHGDAGRARLVLLAILDRRPFRRAVALRTGALVVAPWVTLGAFAATWSEPRYPPPPQRNANGTPALVSTPAMDAEPSTFRFDFPVVVEAVRIRPPDAQKNVSFDLYLRRTGSIPRATSMFVHVVRRPGQEPVPPPQPDQPAPREFFNADHEVVGGSFYLSDAPVGELVHDAFGVHVGSAAPGEWDVWLGFGHVSGRKWRARGGLRRRARRGRACAHRLVRRPLKRALRPTPLQSGGPPAAW